ncbi:MAG: hypothetical protein B6D61_02855 [Bacteroidetes bacterium 4484_249]|nr:MAG: hypothetical protein B6D61_02855 [Bacteroidetes bacterium 4484_249]
MYFFDDSYPDSTIVEWFWQFGDLTSELDTSSYKDYHWKYPSEGFYSVNLWIKDSRGGEHDTTKTIYAGNAIVSDFQHEDVCLGDTVMFIDQSFNQIPVVYDQWEWVFGDGQGVTYYEKTDTVSHYYDTAGVYNVYFITTASVNEIQITDTIMKDIYVYNPPVARIDSLGYTAYCVDGNIQFIDSSYTIDSDSVTSWLWDFGDGVTDTVQNPVHKYNEIDTVWTTLVVNTSFGCQSIDSVEVRLTDSPDISFIWENPCVNSPMHFIPDSSNVPVTYWEWNFGDPGSPDNIIIDSSKYSDPTHVYTEVNNYRVTMIAKSENCEKEVLSESFLIKPIPYSTFSVTPNFNNVQGQTKFENNSFDPNTTIPLNYFWDFGNGETSTIENPIEVYEKDSTYTITLISYNEYNCADTSWYELLVFFKGLYFPTAFSPNNPNEEISLFTPRGINLREYLIQVFDMKGNLMWESEELDENGSPVESWDGYYNGLLMPQGMYVWRAEAIFRDGTIWKGSDFQAENPQPYGTVTLVR